MWEYVGMFIVIVYGYDTAEGHGVRAVSKVVGPYKTAEKAMEVERKFADAHYYELTK